MYQLFFFWETGFVRSVIDTETEGKVEEQSSQMMRSGDEPESKGNKATTRERVNAYVWLPEVRQTGGRAGGQVQLGVLVTGVSSVKCRPRQQPRGQAEADRTSTAALTASFTGTLIGPLMSLEKVVKAMEMEPVLLHWHPIISLSPLCVYL